MVAKLLRISSMDAELPPPLLKRAASVFEQEEGATTMRGIFYCTIIGARVCKKVKESDLNQSHSTEATSTLPFHSRRWVKAWTPHAAGRSDGWRVRKKCGGAPDEIHTAAGFG
eukprot:scaffold77_cov236-Pinguiococcus_pyrenoidosus.AAC.5